MSYSQRLLQQGNSLTRLAHRSRFNTVLNAISGIHYHQALDYGCGDGWLLKVAYQEGIIASGIGVDISSQMLAACQETFINTPQIEFYLPSELSARIPPHSCDLIFCTETLEHVPDPEQIIDQLLPFCQKQAKLVISVPIEVGPSLFAKQIGRYLANLKGGYGYETYSPKELFSAAVLWDVNNFPSTHSQQAPYRAHKGFDYRYLELLLSQKIKIEKRIFSPFPVLGNLLNSTVVWIASL